MVTPPLAVTGLPYCGAVRAARLLQQLGFCTEEFELTPANVDAFLSRGGLLIWLEARDELRLRRGAAAGEYKRNRAGLDQVQMQRQLMLADWPHLKITDAVHLGYVWKRTHVIVYNESGSRVLCERVRQVAEYVSSGERLQLQQLVIGFVMPEIDIPSYISKQTLPRARGSDPSREG